MGKRWRYGLASVTDSQTTPTRLRQHNPLNTSSVERHNGTARRMNPHQVRRSLAFARLPHVRQTVSDLVNGVYNFCRVNRSLRVKLDEPVGRRQYAEWTPEMAIGITDTV